MVAKSGIIRLWFLSLTLGGGSAMHWVAWKKWLRRLLIHDVSVSDDDDLYRHMQIASNNSASPMVVIRSDAVLDGALAPGPGA